MAELDYQVLDGLACPTTEDLRAEVAKEMRYDPFDGAPGVPVGRFHVAASRVRPRVVLIRVSFDNAAGVRDYETEFEGTPDTARSCEHLVKKHVVSEVLMELTIQMARLVREAPPARTACSAAKTEHAEHGEAPPPCRESRFSVWPDEWPMAPLPKPKLQPPEPPDRWPVAIRFGAAVWPERVASGWGSLGLSADVGVRYRWFSAGIEVHGDPPLGSLYYTNVGAVTFARMSGALLLCGHFGWFAGCAVADAGRFIFPNNVPALPPWAFYGAAGARARLEFPVAPPRVFLSTSVDVRAPIHPVNYPFKNGNVFEAAGLGVGLGFGLLLELSP